MIDEQLRHLSDYRLEKADNLLLQAQLLLDNHQYDGSINRSYYAIFNAVRAILALSRLDSRSHRGVISYFDRYFVKTGIFEKRASRIVHEAFDSRQDNDYEDFYVPSEADAREQVANAKHFIGDVTLKHKAFLQGKQALPILAK